MQDPTDSPDGVVKLSRYCGDCGHPIADGRCPECGGGAVPRLQLIDRRRTLGRIFLLLALSWGADAVMLVLMSLPLVLLPMVAGAGGGTRLFVGFVQILFSMTAICAALAATALASGPWALSPRIRSLLGIATAGFFVAAGRRLGMGLMLFVPAGSLVLLVEWIEWPVWIVSAFATIILLHALGICSRMDPGARNRAFLGLAWIAFSGITVVYLFLVLAGWSTPNPAAVQAFQIVGVILFVVKILFLAVVVGFLIPWKRMLARCAANDNGMPA